MRVAINGYFLTRPFTGFGNYTIGLLTALGKNSYNNTYIVFVPEKVDYRFGSNVKIVVLAPKKWLGASLAKWWWEQKQIIREIKLRNFFVVHHFYPATSVFAPASLTQITSIHDATPWHFPEHMYSAKVRVFRKFTVWANKRAQRIITVSHYAKDDISSIFDIAKDKIEVIYNGVNPEFKSQKSKVKIDNVLNKYNIKQPYIFYIGGFEIHKNIRNLFFAYAKIANKTNTNLVLAGGVFSQTRPPVYRDYYDLPLLIKNYKLQDRVQMVGPVPYEDLPALYQGAELFVSPSLAEGFNIPLIEAFASGVPVVASNTTSTAELADHGAYLVDPTDVSAISLGMIRVLNDKKLQSRLIERAQEIASGFSWDSAARRLVEIYKQYE